MIDPMNIICNAKSDLSLDFNLEYMVLGHFDPERMMPPVKIDAQAKSAMNVQWPESTQNMKKGRQNVQPSIVMGWTLSVEARSKKSHIPAMRNR